MIGQNIGTTATSAIAAIGASTSAKRTALAHVLFNVSAGVIAFALLPLALRLAGALDEDKSEGAVTLAAFHTGFNVIAAMLFLPWLDKYSAFVARLVREKGPQLTRYLDASVVNIPAVAVEAARRTVLETTRVAVDAARDALMHESRRARVDATLASVGRAVEETQRFLGSIRAEPGSMDEHARRVSMLHAVDHLERLVVSLKDPGPAQIAQRDNEVRAARDAFLQTLEPVRAWLRGETAQSPDEETARAVAAIADLRRAQRPRLLERTASGELDPQRALDALDATRWVDRLAYHVWRVVHHLSEKPGEADPPDAPQPPDADQDGS